MIMEMCRQLLALSSAEKTVPNVPAEVGQQWLKREHLNGQIHAPFARQRILLLV